MEEKKLYNAVQKTITLADGREIMIETGKLAKQADGAVVVKMGDTMLLATVVAAKDAKEGVDFMPLQVEYKEKFASCGRFPGGFMKREGNRDARSLTNVDGIMVGLAAALSAVPGISRNGAIMFVTLVREADKQNGLNWALLLAVPAVAVMILLDFISIFTVGIGTVTLMTFLGYVLSAAASFVGTYLGVSFIRIVVTNSDYSGFAYYDFGLALFAFALYLIA